MLFSKKTTSNPVPLLRRRVEKILTFRWAVVPGSTLTEVLLGPALDSRVGRATCPRRPEAPSPSAARGSERAHGTHPLRNWGPESPTPRAGAASLGGSCGGVASPGSRSRTRPSLPRVLARPAKPPALPGAQIGVQPESQDREAQCASGVSDLESTDSGDGDWGEAAATVPVAGLAAWASFWRCWATAFA